MKNIFFALVVAVLLIGGALLFTQRSPGVSEENKNDNQPENNVTNVNGKQIIQIIAKGGYTPRVTNAVANIPTIIRITTNNTFDCSSALVISSLSYRKNLPQTGDTDIEIPAQKSGSKIQGLCGMGMYNFVIWFR